MELNTTGEHLAQDAAAENLIDSLGRNEEALGLERALVYYDFPLFRDPDGAVISSRVLILSPDHGLLIVGPSSATPRDDLAAELKHTNDAVDRIFSFLFSKLIRDSMLKADRTTLSFSMDAFIFAPFIEGDVPEGLNLSSPLIRTVADLTTFFADNRGESIDGETLERITAVIEGSNGLIRPSPRDLIDKAPDSKGALAAKVETQIANFDQRQKHGYMTVVNGLQRIRGLAGSGKTVVLAMKAALTHLRNPDATILYTFYTRSLYQFIQRLITRFYRQYDDRDPDWSRLKIMHAWGGYKTEGVYFSAAVSHDVSPLSYSDASRHTGGDAFDYVCKQLMSEAEIQPMFDYVFVDEGQDFPISFLQLCVQLAEDTRVVYAYDELQTIFQIAPPSPAEILGEGAELSQDVVLYKCYRNPREILVVAHSVGFGIYGSSIVQMLENKGHWEDIGYLVREGDFVEGSQIVVERPEENSLMTISASLDADEIVKASVFDAFEDEIESVAQSISQDLGEGLRPDDILVVVVDDRAAKNYLNHLAEKLAELSIKTNNVHADSFGLRDFKKENRVTLSTVHKAKGNEAFMVYVVGVDALFSAFAGVRERNMLFTAMTRAKGWVHVSGIGASAELCRTEIQTALEHFPNITFEYPSEEQLKIMRRDLAGKAIGKLKAERTLDRLLDEMSPEEIMRFVEQRSIPKGEE